MSAWTCQSANGKAALKIVPPHLRIPSWKGLRADSEEKREPASDIETAEVDSLKVLDPEWPIREADIEQTSPNGRVWTRSGRCHANHRMDGWWPSVLNWPTHHRNRHLTISTRARMPALAYGS
jgi:hypothetical protein